MTIRPIVHSENESLPSWYTPVTRDLLRLITQRIVDEFQPEQIVLFGSYAYGKPRADSDVDLLVITNRLRRLSDSQRSRRIAAVACPEHLTLDVFVRTPAQVVRRLKLGDPFFRDIMLKGQFLYRRPQTRYRLDARKWRGQMPDVSVVAEWVDKAELDLADALQIVRPSGWLVSIRYRLAPDIKTIRGGDALSRTPI